MLEQHLITVIIPVYKVEEYLEKCVQAVCRQTYKNLEILLVDDGSPDRCPEMCDAFALQDDRIRVIHKKRWFIQCQKCCAGCGTRRIYCICGQR